MMLPLPLMIIIAALALQLILLIILWNKLGKKKRKIVFITTFIVLGIGIWQGLHEYNRTNKDLSKVKANVKISVIDLIKEYNDNDSSANQKYLGKIIEVVGNIKEVNTDDKGYITVVLGDTGNMSSVRCSIDTAYQQHAAKLAAGSSTIIRGACTGFNKDEMGLGSDVIINRCVVVTNKNN